MSRARVSGREPGTRIERSPADLLRLVVATIVLVALLLCEYLFGDSLVDFGTDLLRGLDAIPTWMIDVVVIGTRLLCVIVVCGAVGYTVIARRWRMLVIVSIAMLLGGVLVPLLDAIVPSDNGPVLAATDVGAGPLTDDGAATTVAIAALAAGMTAAAPWVSRWGRRAGWTIVVALMLAAFVSSPLSFDAALAITIGWLAGAAVLVVGGAPSRRPTQPSVAAGLADVGLSIATLEPAAVDARGSTPYFATDLDGGRLFVKVLGEDERSADLLFRLYRRLQPHDLGDERAFLSLRRTVEHEALVALAVGNLGVPTPRLRAVAAAEPNGHVLAYEAIAGRSMDKVEREHVTDAVLDALWRLVAELHAHRIAHRDLRLANMFLDDQGQVWLIDFGFGELTASDLLLANDVAELIASSSAYAGPARAVSRAVAAIDRPTLARALDRLHPWALSGATRSALKARPGLLDAIRAELTTVLATAAPDDSAAPKAPTAV